MTTSDIKCAHCGSTDLNFDYIEELDHETGFMLLVFECVICDKQTIIQATSNGKEAL